MKHASAHTSLAHSLVLASVGHVIVLILVFVLYGVFFLAFVSLSWFTWSVETIPFWIRGIEQAIFFPAGGRSKIWIEKKIRDMTTCFGSYVGIGPMNSDEVLLVLSYNIEE